MQNAPVLEARLLHDESIGTYLQVTLSCGAREALELWERAAGAARLLGVPVLIYWTGPTDPPPSELGARLGRILAKMGVFLATKEPIDTLQALKEERATSPPPK